MKTKKKLIRVLALCLAITLSMGMIVATAVGSSAVANNAFSKEEIEQTLGKYQKIDVSSITGEGGNPSEISGAASAAAAEKEWYEYITYSSQPVSSIRIDDNRRLIFYDPFDYSNAMIMDVDGEENDWSSANSLEISYTTGKTMSSGKESSSYTDTSLEVAEGNDMNYSYSTSISTSATKGWSTSVSSELGTTVGTSLDITTGVTLGTSFEVDAGVGSVGGETSFSNSVSVGVSTSISASVGTSETVEDSFSQSDSKSETVGWSTVANRVTKATGSSSSTNTNWSTEESKTVTHVYNASYFNDVGSPLQWKIIRYVVYMPMKYELQCKIDGEWITTDYAYCMLTTMQGTCRAYMKNTQAYIEHWGTGEAVLWDDFWDGFFTEDALLEAYKNKLYPDN